MTLPRFVDLVGHAPAATAAAPGRVNLIGEHTDYNGGFVLPLAIPQRTRVEAAPRADRVARIWSAQFAGPAIEYRLGEETRTGDWADYVKGMTAVLGIRHGFDARVESDVPVGSGLSSSAALEIATGRALAALFDLDLSEVQLAVAARRAENEFVGAPVGIMDQMACSLAECDAALWLDTRTLEYRRVPIPSQAAVIVIDSGVSHRHAGGEYARRREECLEAAARLGVPELRDVAAALEPSIERLPEPLNRRARHVVTENRRVLDTVAALEDGDLRRAGRLLFDSHRSLRDDFEVSVPALDALVEAASRVRGVHGARMTGGGFGGSVVALADRTGARQAAEAIVGACRSSQSSRASILVPADAAASVAR